VLEALLGESLDDQGPVEGFAVVGTGQGLAAEGVVLAVRSW
jgi:hypothetical protein